MLFFKWLTIALSLPVIPPGRDESELLDGLRKGDDQAFAEVVDRYSGSLLRVAMAYVPSQAVAEEVVQETWLGVFEGSFWGNMQSSVSFTADVLNGVVKSLVFGFVCTWIAVYQGYDCVPTSAGISAATTKTVVYSSLAVLGLDFVLTAVMFGDF